MVFLMNSVEPLSFSLLPISMGAKTRTIRRPDMLDHTVVMVLGMMFRK